MAISPSKKLLIFNLKENYFSSCFLFFSPSMPWIISIFKINSFVLLNFPSTKELFQQSVLINFPIAICRFIYWLKIICVSQAKYTFHFECTFFSGHFLLQHNILLQSLWKFCILCLLAIYFFFFFFPSASFLFQ